MCKARACVHIKTFPRALPAAIDVVDFDFIPLDRFPHLRRDRKQIKNALAFKNTQQKLSREPEKLRSFKLSSAKNKKVR